MLEKFLGKTTNSDAMTDSNDFLRPLSCLLVYTRTKFLGVVYFSTRIRENLLVVGGYRD